MKKLVAVGAAVLAVSAACGARPGVDAITTLSSASFATDRISTTSTTPESTIQSSTTSTTVAVDPVDSWQQGAAAAQLSAGPSMRNSPPVGVRANGGQVELLTWDGQSWVASSLPFTSEPDMIESLWMQDVTGDSQDDIVVAFFLGQDVFGEVFVFHDGAYRSAPILNGSGSLIANPQVDSDGVSGLDETCEPSCAEGGALAVDYTWNGSALAASNGACAEYTAVLDYGAIAVCNKGGLIAQVQEALVYFGYLTGSADGYFGPATRSAVISYQREVGMFQSGWLSPEDYIPLIEYYHESSMGGW